MNQLCPTRGPHTCGPVEGFVRPSKLLINVYVQYNENLCFHFDILQFNSFDAIVFNDSLSCTVLRTGKFPRVH